MKFPLCCINLHTPQNLRTVSVVSWSTNSWAWAASVLVPDKRERAWPQSGVPVQPGRSQPGNTVSPWKVQDPITRIKGYAISKSQILSLLLFKYNSWIVRNNLHTVIFTHFRCSLVSCDKYVFVFFPIWGHYEENCCKHSQISPWVDMHLPFPWVNV